MSNTYCPHFPGWTEEALKSISGWGDPVKNNIVQVDMMELEEWKTPASDYQMKQVGDCRIAKYTFQVGYYPYHGIDGYTFFSVKKPLICTTLLQKKEGGLGWREWMVDSPTDYRAMQIYARKAYGKVLTTGLGLGLVTHELCKNDRVESITIVELNPNVIELIQGYLPNDPRIKIVNQDLWEFIKEDNTRWDCMIVDIWVYWGRGQQIELYKQEIIPYSKMLSSKYPEAQITFHGFAGMPTLPQLEEALTKGEDTDKLIYGLGGE